MADADRGENGSDQLGEIGRALHRLPPGCVRRMRAPMFYESGRRGDESLSPCPFAGMTRIRFEGSPPPAVSQPLAGHPSEQQLMYAEAEGCQCGAVHSCARPCRAVRSSMRQAALRREPIRDNGGYLLMNENEQDWAERTRQAAIRGLHGRISRDVRLRLSDPLPLAPGVYSAAAGTLRSGFKSISVGSTLGARSRR